MAINEYIPSRLWIKEYNVSYYGCRFNSRMTIIKLNNNGLILHSPAEIDEETKISIEDIGEVACIVAPGNYHFLHISSAQKAFRDAETWICPGIERKEPGIEFDWFLGNRSPDIWKEEIEQVLITGTRFMWEVAFFDKKSRTLILTDLLENFTDETPGTNLYLRLWMQYVFGMWNNPKPGPEYQFGWGNKKAVRNALNRILEWDFERIILSHGELIEHDPRSVVTRAWKNVLNTN